MSSSTTPDPGDPAGAPPQHDSYLARVPVIVERIRATTDPFDAVDLLHTVTRALDADVSMFASFTRGEWAEESYRVLLACAPEWRSDHEAAGWFKNDPWLNYARLHSEPVFASEIGGSTDTERALIAVAARFGFQSAVIAPALSNAEHPRVGVLCLGHRTPGHFENHADAFLRAAVRCVAQELHEWWSASMRSELIASARLDAMDIALLRHARAGHGTKEMARLTGWSTASIDSRFQRLNARLGVATRKDAARLAAECGLI